MKTMIDLPDQLLMEVKTMAAHEQRQLNDLMAELVRAGIDNRVSLLEATPQQASAKEWLAEWVKLGDETLRDAPPGPTATEILEVDRNRLEQSE